MKVTLQSILAGYAVNTTTNANMTAIANAFENTVSRDGTSPNTMLADFDMNSHSILNLGAPQNLSSAARWMDVLNGVDLTGTPIPAQAGNTGKFIQTDGTSLLWGTPTITIPDFYPTSAAEISCGVTVVDKTKVYGDVLRYGIVPNSSGAASSNTSIIKQLCSPEVSASGYTGTVRLTNTTGSDVYYFNNIVTFRPGIYIEFDNSTWRLDKSGSDSTAVNAGAIYVVSNFSLRNGTIDVHWADAPAAQGHALVIGSRNAVGTTYFPNHYDSLLSYKQGNGLVDNMTFKSNAVNAQLVTIIGGVRNVTFNNYVLDGQSSGVGGIYYEWGWATYDATPSNRQTSHAHNLTFTNGTARNLRSAFEDYAIWLAGAYNSRVDGLKVLNGYGAVKFSLGEAMFYNPWNPEDLAGAKHNVYINDVVHDTGAGTSIEVLGAQVATGIFGTVIPALGHPADYKAETDLLDARITNTVARNCAGYGILSSAGKLYLGNNYTKGCQRGIVTTDECTIFEIDTPTILDSTSYGIHLGSGSALWSPAREKMGSVRNGFIAGNGTAGVNTDGIVVANARSVIIENNRFGYETSHDGVAEATQTRGVNATNTSSGVRCIGNYVAGAVGGLGYTLGSSGPDGRGCTIENPQGITAYAGLWGDGTSFLTTLTYGTSMALDVRSNNHFIVTATNGTAFAFTEPTNMRYGQTIDITVRNTFGVIGTITWPSSFKMAAWTNPANGFSRSIELRWNGTNWVELNRTTSDIPN